MSNPIFAQLAPRIMTGLMHDLGCSLEDAAAILGNLGHECAGFTRMQEVSPIIKGSRGGTGWAQWTGPRRKTFEAWAAAHKLKLDSYEANYGFLIHELKGAYVSALQKMMGVRGLENKVRTFEIAYEGAGVPAFASRTQWALMALNAFKAGAAANA